MKSKRDFAPNGKYVVEAFLLLGMCYDVLIHGRFEDLRSIYYEAYIQNVAHCDMERTCYRRYEQSVYLGYGKFRYLCSNEDKRKTLKILTARHGIKRQL